MLAVAEESLDEIVCTTPKYSMNQLAVSNV